MQVVKTLIAKGADVNARDKDGMTTLKWATTNREASPQIYGNVIDLLKAAGAKE